VGVWVGERGERGGGEGEEGEGGIAFEGREMPRGWEHGRGMGDGEERDLGAYLIASAARDFAQDGLS